MSDTEPFKVFVSLPMRGYSDEAIRKRQQEIFESTARPGWELIDTTTVSDEDRAKAETTDLHYLSRSIEKLGTANVVIFSKDWRNANGCIIEHTTALAYGIPCLYEL